MKTKKRLSAQTIRKRYEWANALSSGDYAQTNGILADETGYCCLGVAADIGLGKPILQKGFLTAYTVESNDFMEFTSDDIDQFAEFNDENNLDFEQIAEIVSLSCIHPSLPVFRIWENYVNIQDDD